MSEEIIINKDLNQYSFEQGPIRPPSESYSLLIRVTRNCPWNRCQFCGVYKGSKFELRPADDVIADIKNAREIYDGINSVAREVNGQADVRDVAAAIYNQGLYDMSIRNVALWTWAGAKSVFLQDANSLIIKTPELLKILRYLKEAFPQVNRITSYARSKTAAKKTVDELEEIHIAGLTRLHIGMESGSDKVLELIDKGATAADHIAGGKNVKASGISLSEYIMPGVGGRKLSDDHALETASVLNQIDPHFIRLRSMTISPAHLLYEKVKSGEYEPQTDDEIAIEIRKMIEKLEVNSYLAIDHIMNLLPEIDGKFPDAKTTCLAIIDRYLSLPDAERYNYKVGRRLGLYNSVDDLNNPSVRQQVDSMIESLERTGKNDPDEVIQKLKVRMAL
jgi:radical SAM superfamily enzyme YgiQ (UPF0313 family)